MVRAYSKHKYDEMVRIGFPANEYIFPSGEGSFIGELVLKYWNGKKALVCLFDTLDGNKYRICVWHNRDANQTYRPCKGGPALDNVEIGTFLRVEYKQTKNGNTRWLTAEYWPNDKDFEESIQNLPLDF